eukprot:2105851-Ditylum_brightwellii.AAC.1
MVGVATGQWCPAGAYRGTRELIVGFLLLLGGKWFVLGGLGWFGGQCWLCLWFDTADGNDYYNDDNDDNTYVTKNGVNVPFH